MIVLHEPSRLFIEPHNVKYVSSLSSLTVKKFNGDDLSSEISQYLLLIIQALSLASHLDSHVAGYGSRIFILSFYLTSFFSQRKVSVVLFDSKLEDLRMPIVREVVPNLSSSLEVAHNSDDADTRKEFVSPLLENYFDLIGRTEIGNTK